MMPFMLVLICLLQAFGPVLDPLGSNFMVRLYAALC
jgi:hypothetical protein